MGAPLSTLRRYVRVEVDDPAPLRKPDATVSFQHDGGFNQTTSFQDSSEDFVALGIVVGDVIFNLTDGGSIATIRAITSNIGTNDVLEVDSIDGGNQNEFNPNDICYLYDRHAQKGLDGTRFTDAEVLDAINQAQKQVARKFGGVQKVDVHQDIKIQTKIAIDNVSGTFQVGETITGQTNNYTAVVEYEAEDFLIIEDQRDAAGNLDETALFEDNETLQGNTSGATCLLNEPDTSGAVPPALQGYTPNNINVGQNLPTDLKNLEAAYYLENNDRLGLGKQYIQELMLYPKSTGHPIIQSTWSDDDKIWLWPNKGDDARFNILHLVYNAWPDDLAADSDTTDLDVKYERLLVLLSARILSGQMRDNDMYERIRLDLEEETDDVMSTRSSEPRSFRQEIKWDWYQEGSFWGEYY